MSLSVKIRYSYGSTIFQIGLRKLHVNFFKNRTSGRRVPRTPRSDTGIFRRHRHCDVMLLETVAMYCCSLLMFLFKMVSSPHTPNGAMDVILCISSRVDSTYGKDALSFIDGALCRPMTSSISDWQRFMTSL